MEDTPNPVPKAACEWLERARAPQEAGLADRLLSIGKDCAAYLEEPFRSADHGDLLYGKKDVTTDR